MMQSIEIEKAKSHVLLEILAYIPNSIVSRTIIRKITGNINITAIDKGEVLAEKISPFDTFIQIIEGDAEIIIDQNQNFLSTGQAIIIPAHSSNAIKAKNRLKMISTVIKSGYEESII